MSHPKRKSGRRSFCVRFPKSSPRRPLGLKRATVGAMRGAASLLRQRRLRHRPDPGDALNSSPETVSVTLDSRKRVSQRQPGCLNHSRTPPLLLCALCVLSVSSPGCASRQPIAGRRQRPPAQPSETPADAAESAKRATHIPEVPAPAPGATAKRKDRKSTRLNSSHLVISYAVFCLKKKKNLQPPRPLSPRHSPHILSVRLSVCLLPFSAHLQLRPSLLTTPRHHLRKAYTIMHLHLS